ncbi:Hypothetical predicted protein [Pelobates cultripes]|uniref:Uncharacterized protein n=1 Tax=Pelobates cultripes TaxID=61616 RepID=A0AAD1RI55_PELCU|nr:Hypothetical predicted protein [Pelobates cultripes]
MDANTESVIDSTKMATTFTSDTTATSQMADATSKMASGFKTMTYKPTMPLEMAEDLPPSAAMLIQLIQNLRVDLKNVFKKDFDAMYGAMEVIGQRTEDIEQRLHVQETPHFDLVNTVKDLQKQVNQQAEKMADAEDRSRRNNLRIRGILNHMRYLSQLQSMHTRGAKEMTLEKQTTFISFLYNSSFDAVDFGLPLSYKLQDFLLQIFARIDLAFVVSFSFYYSHLTLNFKMSTVCKAFC